jgi:hypothetical protein
MNAAPALFEKWKPDIPFMQAVKRSHQGHRPPMMRDEELAHIATLLLAGACSALILEAVIGFVLMTRQTRGLLSKL